MTVRLLSAYNGNAGNTIYSGTASEEATLLAAGGADENLDLASNFATYNANQKGIRLTMNGLPSALSGLGVGAFNGKLPKLSPAVNRVRQRVGRARICFFGDSRYMGYGAAVTAVGTGAGSGAGNGTNGSSYNSLIGQTARLLAAANIPTRADSWFAALTALGTMADFNGFTGSQSAGATAPAVVNASYFIKMSASGDSFTPRLDYAADAMDFVYAQGSGNGTLTVSDSSGVLATISTSGGTSTLVKATVTRKTASRDPFVFAWSTGGLVYLQEGEPYNRDSPRVELINLGMAGITSGGWVYGPSQFGYGVSLPILAGDLNINGTGLNDANQAVAAAAYLANLQTWKAAVSPYGDVAFTKASNAPSGSPYQMSDALYAAIDAAAAGAPVFDLRAAPLVSPGSYFDSVHEVQAGYGLEAGVLSPALQALI